MQVWLKLIFLNVQKDTVIEIANLAESSDATNQCDQWFPNPEQLSGVISGGGLRLKRGRRDPSGTLQVGDRRQQLAGQPILGDQGVHQAQRSIRDTGAFREQDD
jgi:hypothetical protein